MGGLKQFVKVRIDSSGMDHEATSIVYVHFSDEGTNDKVLACRIILSTEMMVTKMSQDIGDRSFTMEAHSQPRTKYSFDRDFVKLSAHIVQIMSDASIN